MHFASKNRRPNYMMVSVLYNGILQFGSLVCGCRTWINHLTE